jgi:hypothetical protein
LGVGDNPVAPADLGPATGIDVERQEPAGLRRGSVEIAVSGHADPEPAGT